jgi:hypothetical protein
MAPATAGTISDGSKTLGFADLEKTGAGMA